MISLSINVKAIDKTRLFEGKKGTYLDCVLIETPKSEYNDYMIVESISKEEYDAGYKARVLGNGRIIVKRPAPQPEDFDRSVDEIKEAIKNKDDDSDLPF